MNNFKEWLKKQRIGVLLGGQSAERAISLKTGRAIFQSLKRQGFSVAAIDARPDLAVQLRRQRIDFAYIALHGPGGEDGVVQGLLEWLKIPYTGSGVLASALAMDKAASKRLFEAAGLTTAKWTTIKNVGTTAKSPFRFPLVVKPASQGSAVGITIVKNAKQWPAALRAAFRYDSTALVETFLQGPEITISVLGSRALPIIEILPQHDRPFYDFHAKYSPGGSRHILPARISSQPQAAKSVRLALAACAALGTRGAARVDLIVDKKMGPTLLEVNTIPGMTETSLLPEAAAAAGISFDALVLRIIEESLGR